MTWITPGYLRETRTHTQGYGIQQECETVMSCNGCEPVPRANCEPVQLLRHKLQGSTPNLADRASIEVWMQSRGRGP